MKIGRRVLSVVLCLIMMFGTVAVGGEDFAQVLDALSVKASAKDSGTFCNGRLTWVFNQETSELRISGKGDMWYYEEPHEGPYVPPAPWNDLLPYIKSVYIGAGVTSIGNNAFYHCTELTTVTIGTSVTLIEECAFIGCTKLKDIMIPDSVTKICEAAFYDCSGLTSITIGNSVTNIGYNAFYNCSAKLENITVSAENSTYYSIGNCLIHTNSKALVLGCKNSVFYVDSFTRIASYAFYGCAELTSLRVPDFVTSIGQNAFFGCTGLETITVLGESLVYYSESNCLIEKDSKELVLGCKNSVIPDDVTTIGDYAFSSSIGLTSITIPDSVTSIGYSAFSDCTGLTSITIGNSVTSIGEYAFYGCAGLTSITIPDSVTSIGSFAFSYCSELTSLVLGSGITNIIIADIVGLDDWGYIEWDSMFSGCVELENINVSTDNPVYYSEDNCLIHRNSKTLVLGCKNSVIPDDVTTIGDYAFSSSIGLTSITIPDSVTSIGDSAFCDCIELTDIYYTGTEEQWNSVTVGRFNSPLYKANIHFNYVPKSFNESDRYWFYNGYEHFWTDWTDGTYYMTDEDVEKLFAYIDAYDEYPEYTKSEVLDLMNSEWSGSCYGMATTSILDYRDKIAFNENFDTDAPTMHDVKSPSESPEIMSAINYYMVSQDISFIYNSSQYYDYFSPYWSDGVSELVSTAQKGEPFLFCYYALGIWGGYLYTYGHAIVALDCTENSDGSYSIRAYDNRYPDDDVYIVVDLGGVHLETPDGTESIIGIEFDDDMSAFDLIDIDGPNNDMNIDLGSQKFDNANTRIQVVADGDVTIKNSAGETIKISEGRVSGTMNIISKHIIVRDNADGNPAPVTFVFEVPNSESFTVKSTSDSIDAAITTDSMYASASSDNADKVVFDDDKGVQITGSNMNYKTAISSRDDSYSTVIVKGTSSDSPVSLTYSGDNVVIGGLSGQDEITIFTQNAESDEYTIKDGYEDVQVSTDSDDNIDIKGSSQNDGNYDVSVIEKAEYTVTFKADGKVVKTYQLTEGEKIVKPANPSKDGYIFKGWTPKVPATMPAEDLTFTAVFEKNNPTGNAKLKIPANTKVEYAATVTVIARATGVPGGYYVALYDGKTLLKKGSNTEVSYTFPGEFTSTKNITVKIIDSKGNVQKDANGKDLTGTVEIKAKSDFFAKLIAFFKRLLQVLPAIIVEPK